MRINILLLYPDPINCLMDLDFRAIYSYFFKTIIHAISNADDVVVIILISLQQIPLCLEWLIFVELFLNERINHESNQ